MDRVTTEVYRPNVDNQNFVYTFKCLLFGSNEGVGIYGASAGYTITAANGAAN